MRDVFISHTEEDGELALAIARGLNAAGYSTWCYEDDSDPGPSYLRQVDEELETTQAVVLIISPSSLASSQVLKEVVRAHEAGKPFIPLRRGIAHEAMQQQREWRMALGASVSIAMPEGGIDGILPRVIRGLERSGVHPGAPSVAPHEAPVPPPVPLPAFLATTSHRLTSAVDRVATPTRIGILTVLGVLGVIGAIANIAGVMDPFSRNAALYNVVPAIGQATMVANVAGLGLNIALLVATWHLYRGQGRVGSRIRLLAALMLIAIVIWFVVVAVSALFPPHGRLRPAQRFEVILASLLVSVVAAAPAAFLRTLFRR